MPSTAEIALSLIFYHCARNFKSENFGSAKIQTRDGWVRSPNSTSVLCSPPKDFHCFGSKLAHVIKRKKMENSAYFNIRVQNLPDFGALIALL